MWNIILLLHKYRRRSRLPGYDRRETHHRLFDVAELLHAKHVLEEVPARVRRHVQVEVEARVQQEHAGPAQGLGRERQLLRLRHYGSFEIGRALQIDQINCV